ncbi:MAG: nucleoside phosphorylase [Prevotella sp.]|nr:nucleoside phosphorylase [Prevotella sp.]
MKYFPPSELPINDDGSAFHLHLRPEHVADKLILAGDPARVSAIASRFDSRECDVQSREFHTITGSYKGKRITALSHGIGCGGIDIVVNELDALANIDFATRREKPVHRTLTMVRLGTCGGLQPFTPIGTFIASVKSIGFDGLLNYYASESRAELVRAMPSAANDDRISGNYYGNQSGVLDPDLEKAFVEHMNWNPRKGAPYAATACPELIERIAGKDMVRGITIACGGFYGPQGRLLRAPVDDPEQNAKIQTFRYGDLKITNFEMESSALAGLSALLGHKAMTCCMVVANRYSQEMNTNYKNQIDDLITLVLERI